MKIYQFIFRTFLISFLSFGLQAQILDWEIEMKSKNNYPNIYPLTKTDKLKNVYAIGSFQDSIVIKDQNQRFDAYSQIDSVTFFVTKADSNGKILWVKYLGRFSSTIGIHRRFDLDSNGNILIFGKIESSNVDFDLTIAGVSKPNKSFVNLSSFILKLDSSGRPLFLNIYKGITITSASFDHISNVLFSGYMQSNGYRDSLDMDLGPGVQWIFVGGLWQTNFVNKLDNFGDLVWMKTFENLQSTFYQIFSDKNNNVYFAGEFSGTVDLDPGISVYNVSYTVKKNSPIQTDLFLLKLNFNGDFKWVKTFQSIGKERNGSFAVDQSENVYAVIFVNDTMQINTKEGIKQVVPQKNNYAFTLRREIVSKTLLIKINKIGEVEWLRMPNNEINGYRVYTAITTDSKNDVYIAGYFSKKMTLDTTFGSIPKVYLPAAHPHESFIHKLDGNGKTKWLKTLPETKRMMWINLIHVDKDFKIYTCGSLADSLIYELLPLYSIAGMKFTYIGKLRKYSQPKDTINPPLGIENEVGQNIEMAVYPNPANEEVKIYSNKAGKINVCNLLGIVIEEKNINDQLIINTTNYANGVYIVSYTNDNKVMRKKLVVRH